MDAGIGAWFDREVTGCGLADERLTKRLRKLLELMGGAMGGSLPLACQDWANTKAAIVFSPTIGSARRTFSLGISGRRVSGSQRRAASFSCFTTRQSSPTNGTGPS
jgi:hypothetical protein